MEEATIRKRTTLANLKNFSKSEFLDDLQKIDWKGIVTQTDDVIIIVEQWTKMFSLILEKHAPLPNRRVSERFCPWITKDFKLMCVSRDKLRKQAIRSKSEVLFDAYKQMRNKVNKVNIDLKRDYFTNKITFHEGDIKNTWKTINLVLNTKSKTTQIATLDVDGKKISNHEAIAEHMNTYFCNIGQDLSKKIPATPNPLLEGKYSVNPEGTTFHFQPVNSNQVACVLGKFKTSMGFGTDCIANHFLKIGLPVISDSLCDIFNLSIATGVFPDSWKVARVAPIFKSGQTDDQSNYRPISVLPVLSRIFEKLIFNQLYKYLDTNKHLFPKQSGFRRLYSVVTSLLSCTNDWYKNMDTGKYTALVFIDLKKAFDTVDHDILLKKMQKYGVSGNGLTWFKSYLQDRRQLCKVNGVSSRIEEIHCGVPQGSCLGPLLFIVYINDLPFCLEGCQVTMYADDTSISFAAKSVNDLNMTLNRELDSLRKWLQGNKLSLNVLKTQAMVIGSRPNLKKISTKLVEPPSFSIGGSDVELVGNVKYLGVQIDRHLAWDEHVHFLRSKVSRAIGFLKYAKKLLPQDTLCKMYRGIVEPHLRYCCSVWGACEGTRLQVLQKLQNRAARIVTNSSYDSSASALIKTLNWPTVADMIKVETACMVYKSINDLAQDYLSEMFTKNSEYSRKNLRNTATDLQVPLMKTCNGQRAFSYRGAGVWNHLDLEVQAGILF